MSDMKRERDIEIDAEETICSECNDPYCEGPVSGLCKLDTCGVCGESIENCDHEGD